MNISCKTTTRDAWWASINLQASGLPAADSMAMLTAWVQTAGLRTTRLRARPARFGEKYESRYFFSLDFIMIFCHDFFLTKYYFYCTHEP